MNLKNHFETLTGKGTRAHNEDAVYPTKRLDNDLQQLFMVCDGVGGRNKGEVASQEIVHFLSDFFVKTKEIIDESFLSNVIKLAKERLDNHSEIHPFTKGMATTLALLYLQDDRAIMAHLGDSRIYQIRGGQLFFKTEDHTLVNELIASGQISQKDGEHHPRRNTITRALVANPEIEIKPDVSTTEVENQDLFFLCSDGVLEGLTEKQLLSILANNQLTINQKKQIIEDACQDLASDNYTAILIEITKESFTSC